MSFLKHKECKDCGSSDARGVYKDGSEHCFSCGKHQFPENKSLESLEKQGNSKSQDVYFSKNVELPIDFSENIPKEPLMWLEKYGITKQDIFINSIGWSESLGMLIFPYFDDEDNVFFWQGRYFPAKKPKVFTCGLTSDIVFTNYDSNERAVVIVEDPVSAIKVGKQISCLPLFGSHLSLNKARQLAKNFEYLIMWLDSDKLKTSQLTVDQFSSLFKSVTLIYTEKDPKECTHKEIDLKLSEALSNLK
jgi:hypothetical protein